MKDILNIEKIHTASSAQQAVIQSPLGAVLITEEEGSIVSVSLRDEELSASELFATPLLQTTAEMLLSYFEGNTCAFETVLEHCHYKGTAFQQRVWQELIKIPFGKTISYRQLALRLGDEKCIRAAASANGQNPFAIIVPCHRVIGSNGSLTGYAGGLWRKQWLLEHEARLSGSASQGELF